ncbi:hypothetical protein [Haloferax sp. DFSO60]|uniref:hypothetical protein n=1 Tax=Haloferax sp. DFSO60 TaxID=3388652 RepID=UPI003979F6D3
MYRRRLLTGVAVGLATLAGCTGTTTRPLETRICEYSAETQKAELTITDEQNSKAVVSKSIPLPGSRCTEFETEIERSGTYEFHIELDTGLSGSYTWEYEDAISIQIDLRADEIEFRELQIPAP